MSEMKFSLRDMVYTVSMFVAGAWIVLVCIYSERINILHVELDQYKNIEKLNLPAIVSSMNHASMDISERLKRINRVEDLEFNLASTTEKLNKLSVELDNAKADNDKIAAKLSDAQAALDRLCADRVEFTLKDSETMTLREGRIVIGVFITSGVRAAVVVDNKQYSVIAGNVISVVDGDTNYKLVIKALGFGWVSFDFYRAMD